MNKNKAAIVNYKTNKTLSQKALWEILDISQWLKNQFSKLEKNLSGMHKIK